ncbi:MAG: hypothetical protein ABFD86_24260, partial [Bryobacteraceae bacterium]
MTYILVAAAVLGILALVVGHQLWRLLYPVDRLTFSPRWFARFSTNSYRPMERLLGDGDFAFLARQPGMDGKALRAFRVRRRDIFRAYLRDVASDFERLHRAARIQLLTSSQDRPDLAVELLKLRATFAYAMLAVRWRLALDAVGVRGLDAKPLVGAVEGMRGQLATLLPS